MVIPQRKNQFS